MFIKRDTRFSGFTEKPHIMPLDVYGSSGLLKQAAQDMHPDIENYIKNVRPIPGKNILLIDALGAGEVWGSNVNGDYFGRQQLMREEPDAGYRSFMHHAYPYKHHQNEAGGRRDPSRRFGDKVVMSRYFRPMDRVQLIVIVDSSKGRADDIVNQCDQGMHPDVSMACGVAYDKCSICGSIHRTRKDYCSHARNELNRIYPDGQKVSLHNFRPRFHDISFVLIGAERVAKVLSKVAMAGHNVAYDLSQYTNKEADIEKIIRPPMEDLKIKKIARMSQKEVERNLDDMSSLKSTEQSIPNGVLKMLSTHPLEDIIKTANIMAISFRPEEFQYMTLYNNGMAKEAEYHSSQKEVFDIDIVENGYVIPEGEFNNKIATILQIVAEERSGHYPFIMKRIQDRMEKSAMLGVPTFGATSLAWPVLGGMFLAYKKKLPRDLQKTIAIGAKAIQPYVTPLATATAMRLAFNIGQDAKVEWNDTPSQGLDPYQYGMNNSYDDVDLNIDDSFSFDKISSIPAMALGVGSVPLMYMYSGHLRNKAEEPGNWNKMNIIDKFIAKHPDITSILSLLAVPNVVKTLGADRSIMNSIRKLKL